MNSVLRRPLVLPEDVQLVPINELPKPLREQLGGEEGDFALSRHRARQTSKLINGDAAALLEHFRTPRTIVQVVALFSRKHQIDPEQTLEEALPVLRHVIAAGLLVPEDAEAVKRIRPTLEPGGCFAGYRLLQCIQALDDSELYQARHSDGTCVALKLARLGREEVLKPRLEREVAVLQRLDGFFNPTLLAFDEADGRLYIALTWRSGIDAATAAVELRLSRDWAGLLSLLTSIARGYAALHQQGIIHGDVHPGNLLVNRDGTITIIDYGLADFEGGDLPPSPRGGIGFFYEPEQAAELLKGRPPSRANTLGEQYSVAALLYLLASGHH